jgi:hypothetical protein
MSVLYTNFSRQSSIFLYFFPFFEKVTVFTLNFRIFRRFSDKTARAGEKNATRSGRFFTPSSQPSNPTAASLPFRGEFGHFFPSPAVHRRQNRRRRAESACKNAVFH